MRSFILTSLFGDPEHFCAEIQSGRLRAALGKGEGQIASAAAQVECMAAGLHGGEVNDAMLPQPMQAEALQVVQEIVATGDAGEEVIDLRGALLAGGVERVTHAGSLAQRRVDKSKPQKICFPLRHAFC